MKRVLSTIAAALVAVAFAGAVFAAEPVKGAAPAALPAGHPPIKKEEKAAPAKKAEKKVKKAEKKAKKAEKKEEAPAAAPAAK